MDLQRYVTARSRVDELVRGLNLSEIGSEDNQILKSDGVLQIHTNDYATEDEIVALQTEQESQIRQRIRQIIKQGGLTAVLPTEPISLYDQLSAEQRIYASPDYSSEDIPQQPRFPGEEGIYLDPESDIADFNLFKVTNRLLREDPKMKIFFDANGAVKLAPQLLGDPKTRLFGVSDEDYLPEDPRLASYVSERHDQALSSSGRTHKSLTIQIGAVTFHDHILFTREDAMCVRLKMEVEQWNRRRALDPVRIATGRIEMLAAQVEGELLRLDSLLPRLYRLRMRASSSMTLASLTSAASSFASSVISSMGLGGGDNIPNQGNPEMNPQDGKISTTTASASAMLDTTNNATILSNEELDLRQECLEAVLHTAGLLASLREARVRRDEAWSIETRHFEMIYALWLQIRKWRAATAYENAKLGLFDPRVDNNIREKMRAAIESSGALLSEKEQSALVYIGYPLVMKVRRINPTPQQIEVDSQKWRSDEATELSEVRNYFKLITIAEELRRPAGVTQRTPEEEEERIRLTAFDADTELLRIRDRMAHSRPTPGTPRYEPALDTTSNAALITPEDACNSAELRRRQKVNSQSLVLVLHVNGKELLRSRPTKLTFPQYTASFNLEAHLKVFRAPKMISCRILQMGYFGGAPLAEFTLITPSPIAPPFIQDPSFSWGKAFQAEFPILSLQNMDLIQSGASQVFARQTAGVADAAVYWVLPQHIPLTNEELQDLDPTFRNASRGRHAAAYRRAIASSGGGISTATGVATSAPGREADSALARIDPFAKMDVLKTTGQFDPNDPRTAYEVVFQQDREAQAAAAVVAAAGLTNSLDNVHASGVASNVLNPKSSTTLEGPGGVPDGQQPMNMGLFDGHEVDPELLLIDPHYHVPSLRKQLLVARNSATRGQAQIPLRDNEAPAEYYTVMDRSVYGYAGSNVAFELLESAHTPSDAVFVGPYKRSFATPGQQYPPSVISSFLVEDRLQSGMGGISSPYPMVQLAEPPSQYDLAKAQLMLQREPRTEGFLAGAEGAVSSPTGTAKGANQITDVTQVVREVVSPDFVFTSTFLQDLMRPPRPLYPYRDSTAPVVNPSSCRIIVQVIRAVNLPLRSSSRLAQDLTAAAGSSDPVQGAGVFSGELGNYRDQRGQGSDDDEQHKLNCIVQVSFQTAVRRTGPSFGTSPHWNEVLALPFTTPSESYDPASLLKVSEFIRFTVFDRVDVSHPNQDPRMRSTSSQSSELRMLGTTEMPFSAVYANGSIEAGLDLELPLVHLGYERVARTLRQPMLHVYVTLDPLLLPPPQVPLPDASSLPDPYIPLVEWLHDVRELPSVSGSERRERAIARISSGAGLGSGGPNAMQGLGYEPGPRNIVVMVADVNAVPQLVCRYLSPQVPPITAQSGPLAFTRFVASIPFVPDTETHSHDYDASLEEIVQIQDVWCTSAQFLRLGQGDWEEHAVLLANYYLWWDLQAGQAIYDPKSHSEICEAGGAINEKSAISIIEHSLAAAGSTARQGSRWGTYLAFVDTVPDGNAIFVLRLHFVNGVLVEEVFINPVTGMLYASSSAPSAAVSSDFKFPGAGSTGASGSGESAGALAAAQAAASDWVGVVGEVSASPIRAISCIVSPTNLFANIQDAAYIHETNMNLTDTSLWRPLFTPRGAASGSSCSLVRFVRSGASFRPIQGSIGQTVGLPYEPGPWVTLTDVETGWRARASGLERAIESAFEQWRTLPTAWNLGVGKLFREFAVQRFEATAQARLESLAARRELGLSTVGSGSSAGSALDRAFILRLRASFPGLHGFPMCFHVVADDETWQTGSPISNPILRRIRSTMLHTTEHAEVSFALAVHAHPYTSKFANMWVFIAMLNRNDS